MPTEPVRGGKAQSAADLHAMQLGLLGSTGHENLVLLVQPMLIESKPVPHEREVLSSVSHSV